MLLRIYAFMFKYYFAFEFYDLINFMYLCIYA